MSTVAKVKYKGNWSLALPDGALIISLLEGDTNDPNDASVVASASKTLVIGDFNTQTFTTDLDTPYELQAGKYYFVTWTLPDSTQGAFNVFGDTISWKSTDEGTTWSSTSPSFCGSAQLYTSGDEFIIGSSDLGSTYFTFYYGTHPVESAPTGISSIGFEASAGPPEKATTPYPSDTETGIPDGNSLLTFTWVDGGEGEPNAATSYDVYLNVGSGLELVAEGIEDLELLITDDLNELTEFTWRIDSINDNGTTEGDEWTFTTSAIRGLGIARNPTPSDEATSQSPSLEQLQWDNGGGATYYEVYFGTPGNLSLLATVTSNGIAFGTDESTSLAYEGLEGSTEYNWRVDAYNGLGSLTGNVWSFTTGALKYPDPDHSGPNIMQTERKLVAFANNKVWVES